MLLTSHKITIGTDRYSSPANSRVIKLTHSARMDIPVNVCSIIMSPPKGLKISPDDDIKVELGTGKSTTQVFQGKIASVDWRMDEVRMEALGGSRNLVHAKYNMYFEQSPAGSIVSDLCSEAGVDTGTVQPGMIMDYYAIGSNRNAAAHIRQLAIQCGFDTYSNEKDKLVFCMFIPANVHLLQYAVNILSLSMTVPADGIGQTEVFGESPASLGQGPMGATWFTKKAVAATSSGGSGISMPVFNPSIRSTSMANMAASNYQGFFKSRKQGQIRVMGDPSIKLGDAVQVMKMPESAQNGTYKITGVEHSISRQHGFVTRLNVEAI